MSGPLSLSRSSQQLALLLLTGSVLFLAGTPEGGTDPLRLDRDMPFGVDRPDETWRLMGSGTRRQEVTGPASLGLNSRKPRQSGAFVGSG